MPWVLFEIEALSPREPCVFPAPRLKILFRTLPLASSSADALTGSPFRAPRGAVSKNPRIAPEMADEIAVEGPETGKDRRLGGRLNGQVSGLRVEPSVERLTP